ncbi:MAG: gamma-glutamylcyclotransferase family protein [Methanosarcina sp.]
MKQEQNKTLYGTIFHRNVCWQRSYHRPEGEEIVMALYGSLRNGLYNNKRFDLQNKSEFLGITKIKGYALYSLGPYPGIYPSEDSSVIVEVRRFSGKQQLEVAKSIDYMELFGGYHRENINLEIAGQKIKAFIYVYDQKPESEIIEHGDWVYYLKEQGKKQSGKIII